MGYISETIGNLEHEQRTANKLADAIALLRELEWSGCVNTEILAVNTCPCCYNWKPTSGDDDFWKGRELRKGHTPDCKLADLLKASNADIRRGDVNRDSGTASANGGWLRRLVRHSDIKSK